jgi:predicted short-subunit dehydrogenase-like oxidoreductase (DUF2520 family)
MIESVYVVGAHGRAGAAISARLAERGIVLRGDAPDLVLLCVPDGAIAGVAAEIETGPWIAHVSGATPLSALDPHTRRFGLHPLQTIVHARGPEQLDGAWCAVTAESQEARETALRLADTLGLRPFHLAEADRPLYHAAAMASSTFLVTLYRTAAAMFDEAGAPPEALVPLMRRTIENGFELTGPLTRGDRATIDAHLEAIRARAPEVEPVYRVLTEATAP